MGECNDKGCRQRMEEAHDAVFKDEEGGCRYDINWLKRNLVGKKFAWVFLVVFGLPAYITFVNVWADDRSKTKEIQTIIDKQSRTIEINHKQEERIIRLEEQFCTIREEIKGMKVQQRDDTREILEAIKRKP